MTPNSPFPFSLEFSSTRIRNILVDHDCGKFFLVLFDSPSGVGNCVGMNRYDTLAAPSLEIFERRVVQAALVGKP